MYSVCRNLFTSVKVMHVTIAYHGDNYILYANYITVMARHFVDHQTLDTLQHIRVTVTMFPYVSVIIKITQNYISTKYTTKYHFCH